MVVSRVSSPVATWSLLILLLSIHLAMNHAAVRAVSMRTLNRQRANFVLSTFLDDGTTLTPIEVSQQERIFEWDGVLRWKGSSPLARATIGGPLQGIVSSLGPSHPVTGATRDTGSVLVQLVEMFAREDYLLWYSSSDRVVCIVLKDSVPAQSQLKAWAQGLMLVHRLPTLKHAIGTANEKDKVLELVRMSLSDVSQRWDTCTEQLKAAGWDLDVSSLETASGTRIRLEEESRILSRTGFLKGELKDRAPSSR